LFSLPKGIPRRAQFELVNRTTLSHAWTQRHWDEETDPRKARAKKPLDIAEFDIRAVHPSPNSPDVGLGGTRHHGAGSRSKKSLKSFA
jgi:hypothetical protein